MMMSTKNSDHVSVSPKHFATPSDPYELLETIGNKNFRASIEAEYGQSYGVYDAICISSAETGETKGDGVGLTAAKQIDATTTEGEAIILTKIKFRIIDGPGTDSPAGWTSQLRSPRDETLTAAEQHEALHFHPWAYSENVDIANTPVRYGDVIKVYKAGGCYFYRSIVNRGVQGSIEAFMNSSLKGEIDRAMDVFGKSDGGPGSTMGALSEQTKEVNDKATALFEAALKAEFSKKGLKFRVTSRRRSVRSQAKLIIEKWDTHGEKEVKRNYSSSVYQSLKKVKTSPLNSTQRASATTDFLSAVAGSSNHLEGLALDIRTKWYTSDQMKKALDAVKAAGGSPYLEPTRSGCWDDPGSSPSHVRLGNPGEGSCAAEHIHCKVPSKYVEEAKIDLSMKSLSEISW
jgi:hypothetical protein